VFDAAGDHAKMMEELQSHRNIRLAVLRQGGAVQQPQPAQAAKASPKMPAQFAPPQKALPAQRQDDMSQPSSRSLNMPSMTPGLPDVASDPDGMDQLKGAAPPGLSMPAMNARTEVDDPGDLFGSIDIEESGANGPLRFKVVLARKGPGRLGIDVVLKREANFCGLLVYTVSEGGRVDAWNKQSQLPYRVLPGDHILEVNDISISGDSNSQNDKFAVRMIQELSKDQKNVHFTVERSQATLGEELAFPQDDEDSLVLGGDMRRRLEEQMMPRQVGVQRTDGQDADSQSGSVKSAQMKVSAKAPLPKTVAAPRWQPKSAPLPPGQKDDAVADGEPEEGGDDKDTKDSEEQVTPAISEEVNDEEPKEKEKPSEEEPKAIPAPPGMAPPKPEEGAEPKEPPVKAKPIGAEMSPPPTASPSSRPLPPPPKTVAPAKPGDVSKAKAETKEAEAKISVPAPPSGPAPPPPEAKAASPKAASPGQ